MSSMNREVVVGAKFVDPSGQVIEGFSESSSPLRDGLGINVMWVKIGDIYLDSAAILSVKFEADGPEPHHVTIGIACGPFKTVDYRDPVYAPGGLMDTRAEGEGDDYVSK